MKHLITTTLILFIAVSFTFSQTQLKAGDKLTLGKGTSDNGNFKYVFVPDNSSNTFLGAEYAGTTVQVLSTERSGAETHVSILIGTDTIPSIIRKRYTDFCANTDKELISMQTELEEKKAEFAKDEKNYALIIKNMKQQEIDDYKQRISDYKSSVEKQKQVILKTRWIAVLEPATAAGELKK
jgi:hypothetical protein